MDNILELFLMLIKCFKNVPSWFLTNSLKKQLKYAS